MEKYYIEFEHTADDESYCLQSKWFDTSEDAVMWYIESFDFVRKDDVIVSLMKGKSDEFGNYDDIECVLVITRSYMLKKVLPNTSDKTDIIKKIIQEGLNDYDL